VIDTSVLQMLLLTVTSWLERDVLVYSIEEDRLCGGR
jgi:hypothetical protein